MNLQARLTGDGIKDLGEDVGGTAKEVKKAEQAWWDLHDKIIDVVQSDFSKELASNLTAALNPLEKFVTGSAENHHRPQNFGG